MQEVHDFISTARAAFRRLHGLAPDAPPATFSDAPRAFNAWARKHRLTGLLAINTPDAGETLRTAAYGQAQHSARFAGEAERLYAWLAPRLPALALVKGPALAAQAWPQPGLRSFDDLDFLCARQDYPHLLAGMREAGYAPATDNPRRMEHLWHYGWGVAFRHPDGFLVEANHRFFPPHYPWPRRLCVSGRLGFAPQRLDTATVRAPTPALHLLLSCEHAVWHGWGRLAWIADVAGLLALHPEIQSAANILADGCPFAQQTVAATCGLAEKIFGPGLSSSGLPESLAAQAAAMFSETESALAGDQRRQFHERFMTGREKTAYRLRRIFTPGDGDFKRFPLPPGLRWGYWLLRPARAASSGS